MKQNPYPLHIGFIMDGNRRWAKERGLPTSQGHSEGADALERVVDACYEMGVKHTTFYAFSTENWSRSGDEIALLMKLFSRYLDKLLDRWEHSEKEIYHHTRVRFLGDLSRFDDRFRERVARIERLSDEKEIRMTMNLAMNYGGRADIVQAVNRAVADGCCPVTEEDISARLYTAGQPDPDLIIRTGGEMRLSNFLLWQSSYAEYYSTPCYWPDFDRKQLQAAIDAYTHRKRKFGGN